MKKFVSVLLLASLVLSVFAVSSCGGAGSGLDTESLSAEYTKEYEGTTLKVYNWGEYISDGSDGSLDVNRAFEELTGVKVVYTNYDDNETMYSELRAGATYYDIIIPSDYMIARLIAEDMLEPLDFSNIPNYQYVDEAFKNTDYDPDNLYSVP